MTCLRLGNNKIATLHVVTIYFIPVVNRLLYRAVKEWQNGANDLPET